MPGEDFSRGDRLEEKYRIEEPLGSGGIGSTYLATETATGRPVAVKALHLGRLENWKILELFERETRVLKSLDHEFIPDYMLSDLEGARVRFEVSLRESLEQGANLIAENMDFED